MRIFLSLAALDKEMRSWDTYTSLEAAVKNMLTSLRAVGELQNPAIRERHWQQLMRSTKVRSRGMPIELLLCIRVLNMFLQFNVKLGCLFFFIKIPH